MPVDLAEVADHCREKLIRRHPHVFGEVEAGTAGEVLRNWNQIKREDERGGEVFGQIPETLPSTLYAKKVLKRAESAGRPAGPAEPADDSRSRASGCSPRCATRSRPGWTRSSRCARRPALPGAGGARS